MATQYMFQCLETSRFFSDFRNENLMEEVSISCWPTHPRADLDFSKMQRTSSVKKLVALTASQIFHSAQRICDHSQEEI